MRREDWEARLREYLAQTSAQPFAWGELDCALLACGAIAALTGHDPGAGLRGTYKSAAGAARVLRRLAGGGLVEVAEKIARELGFAEVPPAFAQRGDVVLLLTELGPTLAVVDLNGTHSLAPGPDGPIRVPLAPCQRAWRIA